MFPTQTGEMIIAPMTAICNVEKASRNRPRGFADPFFNSMFRESQRQFIQSDSISIEVLPYPDKPPSDFTGAVGNFKISAWVDSNSAKVNEAVTFNIKIAGSGNIFNFNINPINFPQNMEIFPPISTINRDEFRDQITGELNFEYILIPRLEGQFRINPIALTYFDPNIDSFVTVRSNMTDIMVYPGEHSESVLSKYSREDIKILAEDIRFIRTKTPSWYKSDSTTIPIWIWGVYFVAFSMFLFLLPRLDPILKNAILTRFSEISCFITIPISIFFGLSFIIMLFSFCYSNFKFSFTFFEIHFCRH